MVKLIIKETNFSYSKRHLFDILDLLVEKYNWEYINKNILLDNSFKNNNRFNDITHLLLITGSSEINKFILPEKCKISYIIDDLHTCGDIKQARINNINKIYKIFATYAYCFNKFYPTINPNKVIWYPHSARFIIDFNHNPTNKILISGRITKSQYPNRFKILQLSEKDNFLHYEKPKLNGYRAKNQDDINNKIYGKKYYQLLNKYLICFTCDANSSRPYLVAKHFEILASGSLLFTCNPFTKCYFRELGFIDGEDYIGCNGKNINKKIQWLKDPNNLDEINRIRLNGYNKIKLNHKWNDRVNIILKELI